MEAIILAGGVGSRLRQVVDDVPKPMAPVAGRPFLEIIIQTLAQKGFDRVILSVGYKAGMIIKHFGSSYVGVDIKYQVESSPLGTGGAIQASLPHCQGQYVHIINGDTYLDLDVAAVERLWHENGKPVVVARSVEDTSRYGALYVEDDRILSFAEKNSLGPGLINAGWYLMPLSLLNKMRLTTPFSFESDFLSLAVLDSEFNVHVTSGEFIDIGIPKDYFLAQKLLIGLGVA